ncbi:GNAT family N-acetyltransferase [Halocola ammonii]
MAKIRPYQPTDKTALLEILKLHSPEFFDPSEEEDFINYLDYELDQYFVVVDRDKVIGGGGFNRGFDDGSAARISWDLIHPNYRGKGIGSELLNYRIEKLKKLPELQKIVVRTTQLSYPFYQRGGFSVKSVEEDFWADGYDLYLMEMPA